MIKKKIFVLVPNTHRRGGVANYYRVIKKYSRHLYIYIRRGRKTKDELRVLLPFRLIYDYIIFCFNVWFQGSTLLLNTSLGRGNFSRDGFYMLISSIKRHRVVFFHGWDHTFEKKIDNSFLLKWWLQKTFLKADHVIVLSSRFKKKLRKWGYKGPVTVETTLVEEELITESRWEDINLLREQLPNPRVLYLSGMIKAKGVWEIVEAFKILKAEGNLENVNITMAGDGTERNALMEFSEEHHIEIDFPGYVRNEEKTQAFKKASIFVFASYTEGMPLAVLEAMAFGLPVITTAVGGIPDFFDDQKMGLILENRDPDHIAEKINYLLKYPSLRKKISEYNFNYAKNNFYVSKVAARLDEILDSVSNEENEVSLPNMET